MIVCRTCGGHTFWSAPNAAEEPTLVHRCVQSPAVALSEIDLFERR